MPFRLFSKKFWNNAGIIGVGLFLIIVSLVIYFIPPFFQIKKVVVENPATKITIRGVGDLYGKNLLFVSTHELDEYLEKLNPQLKNVTSNKIFPQTLYVKYDLWIDFASFKANQGYFYLNEQGKIIQKKKEPAAQLPLINYYQKLDYYSYQAGDIINHEDLLTALFFVKSAEYLGLKVNTVDINGLYMIALHLDDKSIIFTTQKDKQLQKTQLESIVRQFKIEGRNYKKLDFRFDKPVVELE